MTFEQVPTSEQKHMFRKLCDILITSGLAEVTFTDGATTHTNTACYDKKQREYMFKVSEEFKNNYGMPALLTTAISVGIDGGVRRDVEADSGMDLVRGTRRSADVVDYRAMMRRHGRLGYTLLESYTAQTEEPLHLETIIEHDMVNGGELQHSIDAMTNLLKQAIPTTERHICLSNPKSN